MRAPALVGIVTALHIVGITTLVLIQGCGTAGPYRPDTANVPPAPHPITPPSVTPAPTARPVVKRVEERPAAPTEGTTYVVQKGDILSKIAQQQGIRTRDLAEYNNLSNPNDLKIGMELKIPPYAGAKPKPASAMTSTPSASPPTAPATGTYVVQPGDTLTHIARRTGTTVANLKAVNGLTSDRIVVKQTLRLSADSPVSSPPGTFADRRDAGGSFDGIPPIDVPTDDGISDVPVIPPVEPPPVEEPSPVQAEGKAIPYTVEPGDTIEAISVLFIVNEQDIIELNNLVPGQELMPGEEILLPPSAL